MKSAPRHVASSSAERNYEQAVENGFYQREDGGLQGKFDNVRRYWEDQITRYALHDFVSPLVDRKRASLSRIRVLDLGAGSGEGYEIMTSLRKEGESPADREIDVLPTDCVGFYKGVDISPAMVRQGERIYRDVPKVRFCCGDLTRGLDGIKSDPPYDIYYSSYGSLSHLRDEQLPLLLHDIHRQANDRYLFVADLVGRFSYEWQCYWDQPGADETNMRQYSMSYLYPREMLGQVEVERFPLRYWSSAEFQSFMSRQMSASGGRIVRRKFIDRSVLVGRHMNTGEFNPNAAPIRSHVNRLHAFNRRTDLSSLIFDYCPKDGYPELNAFFERFQMAWNAVILAAIEALDHWNDKEWLRQAPPREYPKVVRDAIRTIRGVVRNLEWFRMGDPRANIVEPQLGYVLRNLEMDLQEGLGAAHGVLAIYEIEKAE